MGPRRPPRPRSNENCDRARGVEELKLTGSASAVTYGRIKQGLGGSRSGRVVVPFLVGVATGGLAGAVIGTLVGAEVVQHVSGAAGRIERKLTNAERDELRFELLLQ